jgi:hypothetical protein
MPGNPLWTRTIEAVADGIAAEHAFDRLPIWADSLEDAGWDDSTLEDERAFNGWLPGSFPLYCPIMRLRDGDKEAFYDIAAVAYMNGWRYTQPGDIYDADYKPQPELPKQQCPYCGSEVATEIGKGIDAGKPVFAFHELLVPNGDGQMITRCKGSELRTW